MVECATASYDMTAAMEANVVRRLYHFGRSVSDLARACRLMGEGAYDRLHAPR